MSSRRTWARSKRFKKLLLYAYLPGDRRRTYIQNRRSRDSHLGRAFVNLSVQAKTTSRMVEDHICLEMQLKELSHLNTSSGLKLPSIQQIQMKYLVAFPANASTFVMIISANKGAILYSNSYTIHESV